MIEVEMVNVFTKFDLASTARWPLSEPLCYYQKNGNSQLQEKATERYLRLNIFEFTVLFTCRMDRERPERNLLGAMDTACCLKTLFSDSKLLHFSSILIKLTSSFSSEDNKITSRIMMNRKILITIYYLPCEGFLELLTFLLCLIQFFLFVFERLSSFFKFLHCIISPLLLVC